MSDEKHVLPDGEKRNMQQDVRCVLWFAEHAMIRKLKQNGHKKHWSTVGPDYLFGRMVQETGELHAELKYSSTAEPVVLEAGDVSLFAMMLADNERAAHGEPCSSVLLECIETLRWTFACLQAQTANTEEMQRIMKRAAKALEQVDELMGLKQEGETCTQLN